MYGPSRCFLLPAIVLSVTLPAALPAQFALTSVKPTPENSAPTHAYVRSTSVNALPATPPPLTNEMRGDIHMAREEYRAALASYANVESPSASTWDKMGIAYQMLFDVDDAVRSYKQSLKVDPRNVRALNNLATVEDSRQNFSAAERLYKKALRIAPRSANILKNLGTDLILQHQFGRGADAYAQALTINPHVLDATSGPSIDAPSPSKDRGAQNYAQARTCARVGLTSCALAHLQSAFNEGAATLTSVANEDDFDWLRARPEFQAILAAQK